MYNFLGIAFQSRKLTVHDKHFILESTIYCLAIIYHSRFLIIYNISTPRSTQQQ